MEIVVAFRHILNLFVSNVLGLKTKGVSIPYHEHSEESQLWKKINLEQITDQNCYSTFNEMLLVINFSQLFCLITLNNHVSQQT